MLVTSFQAMIVCVFKFKHMQTRQEKQPEESVLIVIKMVSTRVKKKKQLTVNSLTLLEMRSCAGSSTSLRASEKLTLGRIWAEVKERCSVAT